MIKVFIAEDNDLHMAGTISFIEEMGDCKIVGTAKDGFEACQMIPKLCKDANTKPDIALLDISMPGMTGLEVAEEIKKTGVKVIIFTGYYGTGNLIKADELKVKGFLRKEAPFDEFSKALRTVYEGQSYMDSALIEQKDIMDMNPDLKNSLSDNERTVLILYGRGCDVQETAEKMNKSERSVQGYRKSLYERMTNDGVTSKPNMAKALNWAKSRGFISEKDIYD